MTRRAIGDCVTPLLPPGAPPPHAPPSIEAETLEAAEHTSHTTTTAMVRALPPLAPAAALPKSTPKASPPALAPKAKATRTRCLPASGRARPQDWGVERERKEAGLCHHAPLRWYNFCV